MLRTKVKAGALQFVLFVGTLIAVLLLAFVLVAHTHNFFRNKTEATVDLIRHTDDALSKSLSETQENQLGTTLFENRTLGAETTIKQKFHGVFEVRSAHTQKGAFTFEKWAFVGHAQEERPALYLKDNQRPLVLAGHSRITGTAFLPAQGAKMGNIQGNSYRFPQLIYGEVAKSTGELPQLSQVMETQINALAHAQAFQEMQRMPFRKGMVLKNSFEAPAMLLQGDHVVLENMALVGHIVVWASDKIIVEPTAQLRDVVLIAPQVEIKEYGKGVFQVIASQNIRVGKKVEMDYPSALVLQTRPQDSLTLKDNVPHILLDAHAQVRGSLFFTDAQEQNKYKAHVKLEEHATVYGEVYCTGNLELKGGVHGTVTTAAFVALENGNIYQNHLYNGRIHSGELPIEFSGIPFKNNSPNHVMKWLY